MTIIARPATPGKWADASTRVTQSGARALLAAGYIGIFRTLALPGNPVETEADELLMLTGEGLEVGFYQRVRGHPPAHPLWSPVDFDGAADGGFAVHQAIAIGVPATVHLAQDLEAVDGSSGQTMAYCMRWGHAVKSADYGAELYVGYSVPLTPQELYSLPDHDRYGSDTGNRKVATRGTCWRQTRFNVVVAQGLMVDEGVIEPDLLNCVPTICASA